MPSKRQIIRRKALRKAAKRQAVDLECPICYRLYGSECNKESPVGCTH